MNTNTLNAASVRGALAGLALSMLMSSLGTSIANVALPTLELAFHVSFQQIQWVVLAYLLTITSLVVSAGRLGDVIGRKRLLLIGLLLFTLASALCGLAATLMWLVLARSLQGLGAAIMMALIIAFVGETVGKERIGSAMGLLGTTSAIGTALGPSIGGVLISAFGWQAIFWINIPLGATALFLVQKYVQADSRQGKPRHAEFDKAGTLVLVLTLIAYALAMTFGRGHYSAYNLILLMLAIVGVVLFIVVERKVPSPLVNLSVFRSRRLSASLIMNAVVATVMMTTLVVGPFYLSRALGLNEALVGMVMSVGPVISMFSGIPAGRIVDRLGAPFMITVGLFLMATGAFALAFIPGVYGVPGYLAAIAFLTPGYQLFQASNNTAVMVDVAPGERGVISGMLNLSRNLGLITGASVMGAFFALASGTSNVASAAPDAVAEGMQITFLISGILVAATLAVAWLRGRFNLSFKRIE